MANPTDKELETEIQKMIDAGYSQDDIAHVVQAHDDVNHPIRAAVAGAVDSVPGALWGAIVAPWSIAKGVVTDAIAMAHGGDPTYAKETLDALTDLPKQWKEGGPRERGTLIGNILTTAATGIVGAQTGPASVKSAARGVGHAVETMGRTAGWPARISGSHALLNGNPVGAALMLAPEYVERGGMRLRQWGERGTGPAVVPGNERLGIPMRVLPDALKDFGERTNTPIRLTTKEQSDVQNIARKSAVASAKKMVTDAAKGDQESLKALDAGIQSAKQEAADARAASGRFEDRMRATEDRADLSDLRRQQDLQRAELLRTQRASQGLKPADTFSESTTGVDAEGVKVNKTTKFATDDPATSAEELLLQRAAKANGIDPARLRAAAAAQPAAGASSPTRLPSSPLMQQVAESDVEQRAALRGTPQDVPNNPSAQAIEAARTGAPVVPPEDLTHQVQPYDPDAGLQSLPAGAPSSSPVLNPDQSISLTLKGEPSVPDVPASRSRRGQSGIEGLSRNDAAALRDYILQHPDATDADIMQHIATERGKRQGFYRTGGEASYNRALDDPTK